LLANQEPTVPFSRRHLLTTTAILALAGAAGVLPFRLIDPADAEATKVDRAELEQQGPEGDVCLGSDKAPVLIIEYASMTCPHCAHFAATTFPELKKRYIDTGKVRYTLREFPLDPLAAAGFMLARCAGGDRYYPVVETLFAKQIEWVTKEPVAPLSNIAKQFGFTEDTFKACLTNQKVLDSIEAVRDRAAKTLGVNSTPTFFVNGTKLVGDVSIEDLAKVIDPYLKEG
jgi:protein-disulfide isomerase